MMTRRFLALALVAIGLTLPAVHAMAGASLPPAIPPLRLGPVGCGLGDSITANAFTKGVSNTFSYNNKGYLTWWRQFADQRFEIPLANNFAVAGDTLAQIAVRIPQVIAAAPDWCLVHGGTNDISGGTSYASMRAIMTNQILAPLIAAGIQPIVMPILPKTGMTTAQAQQLALFNTWLRELGKGRADLVAAAGFPAHRRPIVIDATPYLIDAATGNPATNLTFDGLHPSPPGAWWIGKALNDALTPLFPPMSTRLAYNSDIYDATNNPGGNLLFSGTTNYGLMQGTGGTLTASTGVTPTGQVASGWAILRSVGTSTMTVAASKENPRTDAPWRTGERQRVQVNATTAGGNSEVVKFQLVYGAGTVSPGDKVYMEAKYSVAVSSNLIGIAAQSAENGPAAPQFAIDGGVLAADGGPFSLPSQAYSGTLKTSPITVQSGTTSLGAYLLMFFKTDGGSASADIYWSAVSVRKVQPRRRRPSNDNRRGGARTRAVARRHRNRRTELLAA